MDGIYRFGDRLTNENYEALRKLAQKLSYKDFCEATGFKQGIHTRLRKFSRLQEYKNYIADNRRKYSQGQGNGQKVTLKDIYKKLLEIEKKLN